jgi:hypothetical protein
MKRAMFLTSVAKYRPHRPHRPQSVDFQGFRAVGIYRHHHPRRGLYRPHLTDSDRESNERDRRFLRVFLGFNVSAVGADGVFAT